MLMVHVNGKDYEVEQDTKLMRFLRDDLRSYFSKGRMQPGRVRNLHGAGGWKSHKGMYSNAFQAAGKICSHSGRAE